MESRRVMTGSMETGRFMLRQGGGWDANSALENYNDTREADFRVGGAYGTRSFVEGGYPRENIYPRESFHRDPPFLEREGYEIPPPGYGMWPGGRHSTMEDELMTTRSSQRYEKVSHVDNYREHDNYRETGKIRQDDSFREHSKTGDVESYSIIDRYSDVDGLRERGYDRSGRYAPHDRDRYDDEDTEYYRSRRSRGSHEGSRDRDHDYSSRDRDHDYSRHGEHDSDYERGKRERGRHRHRERERGRRGRSREQDRSLDRERHRERSRSYSNDDHGRKSRSPHGHGRGRRESSQEEARYEVRSEKNGRKRDRDGRRSDDRYQVAPSATLVVKGLSQKTIDDDLYEALKDWGPLRHVRVIREKSSGISRGFAFVDFPSVEAAEKTMEGIGDEGMVVDGRRLFLEYSSKPTGSVGGLQAGGSTTPGLSKTTAAAPADWTCAICACVNFARRISCFQCNEARTEDALPGDMASGYPAATGKKGAEGGPTHVLVLRGLDEHVNEDDLHYEFSKYALIKDLRLVRDKFTNVSRGFAFIHFHSVDDASKALEASNGRTLEKKGQILRVAYAKSIHGPGPNAGSSIASSLAATAIEAANFAQQYNSSGWAPKQYNLNQDGGGTQGIACEGGQSAVAILNGYSVDGGAPHSGFVWDEASGYYYDAASGFYYDGHRGLYYDGNNGIWYTYSQESQKYVPYVDQTAELENTGKKVEEASDEMNTITTKTKSEITNEEEDTPAAEKAPSLPEAVQAAAMAAQAANKKEKKEIRLASKGMLLASKKKINNAMNLWKQRKQEGGATLAVPAADERQSVVVTKINSPVGIEDKQETAPVSCNSSGFPTLTSHSPTTAVKKIDALVYSNTPARLSATSFSASHQSSEIVTLNNRETPSGLVTSSGRGTERVIEPCVEINLSTTTAPFKTDVSALGSYGTSSGTGSRRRFSETPLSSSYRDRAAERRSLYGSSALSDVTMDSETSDRGREMPFPPGVGGRGRGADMPFPPGVGAKSVGSAVLAGPEMQSYEVITLEKAIDETNVGNRMLRNMGWQEGLGLGKDGSGIVEPLQAQSTGERAGLGSQSQRKLDARFETQPGDTYKIAIQRKALARFHDMM